MGIRLEQEQKKGLSKKMLPAVEILQMNAQELTDFIKELSLENPVVDVEEAVSLDKAKERMKKLEWLARLDEQNRTFYQYDRRDTKDDLENISGDDSENLAAALMLQLMGKGYSELEMGIFEYIANSLDPSGYYTEPLAEVAHRFSVSQDKAGECLAVMKGLEPVGVCAGSLQECLEIQLHAMGEGHEVELGIVAGYMELLGKNQLPAISKKMKVSLERVKTAAEKIRRLNPRPAQGFEQRGMLRFAVPDMIVVKFQDRFEILQNTYAYPAIHKDPEYLKMLQTDCGKEAKDYLAEKIHQIDQVQEAIAKRSAMLLDLTKCLVEVQEAFFLYGTKSLRPFTMKETAERLDIHESTVSRAVKGKYLQCSWGIYPFSYFFSRGFRQNTDGKGDVTAAYIKQKMKELIDGEDKHKPYSDQRLTDLLKEEGMEVSRRTIVKYREAMEIASSRGRKQF